MSADRKLYWYLLSHDEQVSAIRRMAGSSMSVDTIAGATGLSAEQIRSILAPAAPMEPPMCERCQE